MNFRRSLLVGTSALALNAALTGAVVLTPKPAQAACLSVSGSTIIGNSSADCIRWTGGSISLTSAGTITGSVTGISNAGNSVGTLTNSGGSIGGSHYGILNGTPAGTIVSTIGAISNTGTISGGYTGIANFDGTIGTITNSGIINGGATGIDNADGIIGAITNSGTISGNGFNGIGNLVGTIGTITNTGSITGGSIGITNSGSIGVITNSITGVITGTSVAGIQNGTSAGTIASTIGTITNSGSIGGGGYGIVNQAEASIGVITNTINGVITGGSTGIYNNGGTIGIITNAGSITGGRTAGIYNNGGAIGTIANSGSVGGGHWGIINSGSIGVITNTINGVIASTSSGAGIANVGGTIGTIANSGIITGAVGVFNFSGTIGVIANTSIGTISGATGGVINYSATGAIINRGSISGEDFGIQNGGGSIGVITNASTGTITGGESGIDNGGSIGTITNNGVVSGNYAGIINYNGIGTITNTGSIDGAIEGIDNFGSIGAIVNNRSGVIRNSIDGGTSNSAAISNSGTIGVLTNSGLISGPTAILSTDSGTILSALTNAGTISGNINVSQDLTITGGNSSTIGTLTGYNGSLGTITATDVVFDSGAYQFLNDDIITSGGIGTVTNDGVLRLNATHSISGNYVQGSGALLTALGASPTSYGNLNITGDATVTHVSIGGVLEAGEHLTIVSADTADYTGVTAVTDGGFTASVSSITGSGYDDLIVSVSGGYASIGGLAGGNAGPVGAALAQIQANIDNNGTNTGFAPILTALNNIGSISGAATEGAAMKQLAPNQITPGLASAGFAANQMLQMIGQHQEALLSGESMVQNGAGSGMAAGDGYQTIMTPGAPSYQNGVFWGQMGGGIANRATTSSAAGYSQSLYGLAFGADDHIDRDTTAGLAFSWAATGARGSDAASGNSLSVNSFQLTGYGTRHYGPGFVDLMGGIGANLFDERRNISFLGESAHASYDGMQYVGRIDGGWDFPQKIGNDHSITLTPLAGFQAVHLDNDGYSESGAGAADATVSEQSVNIFTTTLGGKIMTTLPTQWGWFTPEFRLFWAHDLTPGAVPTTATLGGVSFATQTPRVAQDGAQITLSTTLKRDNAVSFRAEYDGDIRDGYQAHTGLVKLEWDF